MKLQCDVEVVNRMLPTFGMKSRGKGTRAVLSIGKHTDKTSQRSSVYMMICTAKDRAGSKYKLKDNIEKFFTWFVEEGKATVRLKEPAVDICLSKADANSLKNFLSAARLADRGRDAGQPSPLHAHSCSRQRRRAAQEEAHHHVQEGLPPHVQLPLLSGAAASLLLQTVTALRKLDLSNNHIKKLPATIGDLSCLSELILHNNHLEAFSVALCLSTLQRTLQLLDLSQNQLQSLPAQFCQLRELVNLKLDDNELVCLPFHIGRLSKLRFLSAAHNQLAMLPSDFRRLRLGEPGPVWKSVRPT
ncbi:Leucine-rich repeat protein 1 [Larimichthys crocea]|uniref:Uncharacterized protein n=1 Tax=Larimichthys crocea TaxID=215358 RepID=A0ACD3RN43_LARCR|nr:Leucine-rich repeat protein 1 [Larimichthys crocea]